MLSDKQLFFQNLGLPSIDKDAVQFVDAKGIYLTDINGHQHIDLVSGVSVSNLGHGHPSIIEAIKRQAETYAHLMVYGKFVLSPQTQLAGMLAQNLPSSLNSTYLVNTGSEAIEGAMKLAKRHSGRPKVMAFHKAYHGSTQGALSILGNDELKNAFRPLIPGIEFLRFNNIEDLQLIDQQTAAVFIEPVQTEAGVILAEPSFLSELRKRCTETGTLLVFDEVQMGMGRSGKLFCFEHYNIVPDILVLAKALGGGMPLGAFITQKEIMHSLTEKPELGHITTFGGHPVSCAAAIASLEIISSKEFISYIETKGQLFEDLLKDHPAIKEIRRLGLMLGVEISEDYSIDDLMPILKKKGIIVDRFLFNETSFRIAPPLIISDIEIQNVSDQLISCLNLLEKK